MARTITGVIICPLLLPKCPGLKDKLYEGDSQDACMEKNEPEVQGYSFDDEGAQEGFTSLRDEEDTWNENMSRSRGRSHIDAKAGIRPCPQVVTPWSAYIFLRKFLYS